MGKKGRLAWKDYDKNVAYLKDELALDKSFDLICLELEYHEVRMALFVVDAFAKDEAWTQIQRELDHIEPSDLGYINPHGIAVPANDRGEIEIFRKALGEAIAHIPLSATKPMTGHVLGGGGALELAGCCLMLENNYLHPTINFSGSPASNGLDFIANVGRAAKVDAMLSVSFGFGGYNAACVIRRFCE